MSTGSFTPDEFKAAVVGAQMGTTLGEISSSVPRGLREMYAAPKDVLRRDTTSFTVREIANGYVVMARGVEHFCENITEVGARVVAVMAAAAMDNEPTPNPWRSGGT